MMGMQSLYHYNPYSFPAILPHDHENQDGRPPSAGHPIGTGDDNMDPSHSPLPINFTCIDNKENVLPTSPLKRKLFSSLTMQMPNGPSNVSRSSLIEPNYSAFKKNRIETCTGFSNAKDVTEASSPETSFSDLFLQPSEWFSKISSCFHGSFSPSDSTVSSIRMEESMVIGKFWSTYVDNVSIKLEKKNAAMFISGPPGTGKSAFVREFLSRKHPLPVPIREHVFIHVYI